MAERRLIVEIIGDSRSLERSLDRSGKATKKFGRDLGQSGRGVVAVSGLFSGLGRQVAFASGAFLGGAGLTKVLRDSNTEAKESLITQRQLAAQFRAAGQELGPYQRQIDATSTRLSRLAGIQDEELKQAFTTAFRGTRDVAAGLKVESVAADVARGRNIDLSTAAIALTKAYLGQSTALKRLGIQVPANVKGMELLALVGERFAGQAKAGTTNQERLHVALKETEETIGRALLPTVEKLTGKLADYLNKTENQQKIQDRAEKGAKILGGALGGLGKAYDFLTSKQGQVLTGFVLTKAAFNTVDRAARAAAAGVRFYKSSILGLGGAGGAKFGALEQMRGAGAAALIQSTGAATGGGQGTGRLGLLAREAKLQLALTKAERTATDKDDRATLVEFAALIRDEIASKKKVFKDKLALNQKLTQIDQQIQTIDDAAAQKRQDQIETAAAKAKKARDKERTARKKAHDSAIKAAKKQRDEALQESRDVHAQAEKLRDLIQTERDRIGDLFSGPFLNPTEAQQKRALGAPTPGSNIKALINDLKGQIRQFKDFQKDLATLAKRGAPPELLNELRQGGLAVAPEVHALATGSKGQFAQFKQLFIQRERLAVSAAKQERPINVNVNVFLTREGEVKVVRTTPHGQARGRNPGVLTNPVNPGRP